jgi:hypothetical protein
MCAHVLHVLPFQSFSSELLCRAYHLKSNTFHVMRSLLQRFEDLSEEIQKVVEAPTLCLC